MKNQLRTTIMSTTILKIRKNRINADGKTPIFIQYCHNQKTILISTGEKIYPNDWDPVNSKVRKTFFGHSKLNDLLKLKLNEIEDIRIIAKQQGIEPTLDYIKQALNGSKSPKKTGIIELFEDYIKESKITKAQGTIKQLTTCKNHIEKFSKEKNRNYSINDIDKTFYDNYTAYLLDNNISNNSIGTHFKNIKSLLNYLTDKNINTKTDFRKFKILKEKQDFIYFTKDELEKLRKLKLKLKHIEYTRDIFLLGCSTGLRYSDLEQLTHENIKNDTIHIRTKKTKDPLTIPLNDFSREIINKYLHLNNIAIPKISNQKFNKNLKTLGQLAKLNDTIEFNKYKGAERENIIKQKWELMTSHTMRRTFITQSLERGIRPEIIMKITGHSDYKTMQRYIQITDKTKATEIQKAWKIKK